MKPIAQPLARISRSLSQFKVREFPSSPTSKTLNLDQWIQVHEDQDEKGRVISRFVYFRLNPVLIQQIIQAKEQEIALELSQGLRGKLRVYTLFDERQAIQSGATFCSHYESEVRGKSGLKEFNFLMRSVISLDGDILHQIRADCLEDKTFAQDLATAHYWLVEQVLTYLNYSVGFWLNGVSWLLSGLSVFVTAWMNLQRIFPLNLWTLIAPILMAWLLQIGFKILLRPLIGRLLRSLLRHLWMRLFSPTSWQQKLARFWLERIMP